MVFTIKIIKQSNRGSAQAFLLEDGDQVAKLTRKARVGNWIQDIEFKWYSNAARSRFCDFADSISMSECAEALGFPI